MPHFEEYGAKEDCGLEPIAIVGMACRLPGSIDSPSSLWEALVQKRSMQTPKVPASRFNIDAYLHERLDRPGSFNVPGGYFLDGRAEDFDPSFFNMTPIEAMWLDPQQRKMLEVAYECLEAGGLTLDAVSGSNTAVFVGSFTSDYQQMSTREPDFRHNYAATGVDPGLISARIGHVFNLNGPIFTINTACSSAIYAIHNACNALRARDCDAAIAGGVNLILTVDQHMNTAKLGILSPTSTCHTFDASADGYGRAEGAGALYLKRLADAIRDGDPVRAVIRSSAVNTNGKVPGMGITHPSEHGQERVVRAAYARARLDPARTAYVECHGTGTPVGDPIESRAVARAMNDARPADWPLLVGAIKANIGHSEAASGIFAVMKAALMTEAGVVPGVAGLKRLNPAIREQEWGLHVQADTVPWPQGFTERRAGVSSFGYGGTNGHVIVESVDALLPQYSHGRPRRLAAYNNFVARPFLIAFSAHDRPTLERNITAHAAVADRFYLADLAYTLLARRSRFTHRGFTVACESAESIVDEFALSSFSFGSTLRTPPALGFVFTGQGAQWPRMGAAAMAAFPPFLSTICALDRVLQDLDPRPLWTLKAALLEPAETSSINDAEIAQPVCTAVQIAIVDLFARWDIFPTVTVGHSSGEIAAAYAAGLVSAPEAIIAAFLRGYAVKNHAPVGSMLAVGLGPVDVSAHLAHLGTDLVVACQNSPTSVTLSGTPEAVTKAKESLQADGVFARELPTGKAYHSPQMANVAVEYNALLSRTVETLDAKSLEWRRPRARWMSSVTGVEFTGDYVPAAYWSENLRNRVLFDAAVAALGTAAGLEHVTTIIEIGPHSALAGPFKQICQANKFDRFTYVPSLVRNKDSAVQLLKTAGALFVQDYPLDVEEVNSIEDITVGAEVQKNRRPMLLVDLPPYQWNYGVRFWAEPRVSHEQRNLTHTRHDLLGSSIAGLSERSRAWRNVLRHKDLPWLKDHRLGKEAVFPAAAHLSLACEALRQVCETRDINVEGVTFRDVAIKVALVIPETEDGIEIQLHLNELHDGSWFAFAVESFAEGQWSLHCEGTIAANYNARSSAGEKGHPVDKKKLTQRVPGKRWYDAFNRVGFEYGPSFQPLSNIRTDSKHHHAAADVHVDTKSSLIAGESRYVLHPSTIDGCLQLIIISINSGLHKEMQYGVVPINIEELSMWPPSQEVASVGHAVAWTDELDGRYFNTHTKLTTGTGELVLDVKSLRCVSYEAAVPQDSQAIWKREPYMETVHKPDITTLTASQAVRAYPSLQSEEDTIAAIVELIQHKKPIASAVLLGQVDAKGLQAVLMNTSSTTPVTLADISSERLESITAGLDLRGNVSTIVTQNGLFDLGEKVKEHWDLVIVGKNFVESTTEEQLLSGLEALVSKKGKIIFSIPNAEGQDLAGKLHPAGFSGPELVFHLPEVSVFSSTFLGSYQNGYHHAEDMITLFYLSETSKSPSSLLSTILQEHGCVVQAKNIAQVNNIEPTKGKFIIHDADGALPSSLTEKTFETLKALLTSGLPTIWVTSGVNEGKSVAGAMSQGLLRAIRSEHAAAKITLLDADIAESPESVGEAVLSKLGHIATKDSGADTEFWLHNGIVNVPRVVPNDPLNVECSAPLSPVVEALLPRGKALHGKFVDGKLVFQSQNLGQRGPLPEIDVELQVEYASLDKADFQAHAGGPRVVAGEIIAVGSGLDPSFIGQKAVSYAANSFSTVVRAPISLGASYTDFEGPELVATLPDLTAAVNAVFEVTKLQADEHLLLLPAPTSFVAAVATLKRASGFRLTVIAETEVKRQEVLLKSSLPSDAILLASDMQAIHSLLEQTEGDAPNAVISHEFSSLGKEVWRFMPPMSRYILNDGVVEGSPDTSPFLRGASFLSTGVASLYKRQAHRLGDLLRRTLEYLKEHRVVQKPTVHDISSLNDLAAFSHNDVSMHESVLHYKYARSSIFIQPSAKAIRFPPEVAYLLVGCLGGLGRSLTTLMMERGARDFVFLSRSGADKPEAAALVESIKKAGAVVQVFRVDASNEADVVHAVSTVSATRPIRGVVHAAMVLQDGMFDGMTFNQFNAAVVPKVKGAQNLHKALQATPLDFFVMTSSISATLGNPGQANYCAANSYLDALAWHRNLQGLPATSLILPMILDVGVVSENENIEAALSRKAMYGIDEREMLRGFETAMMRPVPQPGHPDVALGNAQIILGLEPAYLAAAIKASDTSDDAYWYNDARFSNLRAVVEEVGKDSKGGSGAGDGDFTNLLKTAQAEGPAAVLQTIATHVTKKLSTMLLIPAEAFEFEGSSVANYGLDSMIGADLRNWLFKQFSMEMAFQQLLAPKMTIRALSTAVAQHLRLFDKAVDA